jgi:hypothetical protein
VPAGSDLLLTLDELAELEETELVMEIEDELDDLCRHAWLMRLILSLCSRRRHAEPDV